MEIIPSEVANVMREPLKDIAERCGLINDAVGFESLHDAVFNAEHIGASIVGDVEPENLLFIFGQTIQSLGYAPIDAPMPPPFINERNYVGEQRDNKERNGNNKGKPKNRAIVLCKLRYANTLKELGTWKEKGGRHYPERYEITWSELQKLKECLGDLGGDHFKRPNV